jgi:hypothetical protein
VTSISRQQIRSCPAVPLFVTPTTNYLGHKWKPRDRRLGPTAGKHHPGWSGVTETSRPPGWTLP